MMENIFPPNVTAASKEDGKMNVMSRQIKNTQINNSEGLV